MPEGRHEGERAARRGAQLRRQRVISFVMSLCMVFSYLPTDAFAAALYAEEDLGSVAAPVEYAQSDANVYEEAPAPGVPPAEPEPSELPETAAEESIPVDPVSEDGYEEGASLTGGDDVSEAPVTADEPQPDPQPEPVADEVDSELENDGASNSVPPEEEGASDSTASENGGDSSVLPTDGKTPSVIGSEPSAPEIEVAAEEPLMATAAASNALAEDMGPLVLDESTLAQVSSTFDPGTEIKVGQTVKAQLTIAYDNSEKPSQSQAVVYYMLPSNISLSGDTYGKLRDSDTNEIAGSWEVQGDKIVLTYDHDWLEHHQNYIKSTLDFDFTLKDDAVNDEGKAEVKFPGVSDPVIFEIQEPSVDGGKQGWLEESTGETIWEIWINPNAPVKDLTITDILGKNIEYVEGSFTWKNGSNLPALNPSITTDAEGNQQATISVDNLPAGSYSIEYRTKVKEGVDFSDLANGEALSGTGNTARWTWTGVKDTNSEEKQDNGPQYTVDMVGAKNVSASDRELTWTVTLNTGNLKADMGGYVFTDTLGEGQSYSGSFEVYKAGESSPVYSGTLPSDTDTFTYEFPVDAGDAGYTIVYKTLMDEGRTEQVTNHVSVDPGDGEGPADEGTGSYNPPNTKGSDLSKTVEASQVEETGVATWTVDMDLSSVSKDADPASIQFTDNLSSNANTNPIWYANANGEKILNGDANDFAIVVKTDSEPAVTLVRDVDYAVTNFYSGDWGSHYSIVLKNTEAVRTVVGSGHLLVQYDTVCDKKAGTYKNNSSLTYDHVTSVSSAEYTIEKGEEPEEPDFSKTATSVVWDAGYDAGDGTMGAWITTWEIRANSIPENSYDKRGAVNTKGADFSFTDTLPNGMNYDPTVQDSLVVEMGAGHYPGTKKWSSSDNSTWWYLNGQAMAAPTIGQSGNTLSINVTDVDALTQQDGTCYAWIVVTYKTVTRAEDVPSGTTETFVNSVVGNAGDIDFGEASDEVTIAHDVLTKKSEKLDNATPKSRSVKYTIQVNPHGVDLDPNSNTLMLSDVLDPDCRYVPRTLVIVDANDPSVVVDCPVSFENVEVDGLPTVKMTIEVPDSRALTVTYEVNPIGDTGRPYELINNCNLAGVFGGESSDKISGEIADVSGTATGESGVFTIYKYDAYNVTKLIPGATFALYQVDLTKLESLGDNLSDEAISAISQKIEEQTTGPDGVARFGVGEGGVGTLDTHALYYYEEIEAPEGYNKTDQRVYAVLDQASDTYRMAVAKGLFVSPGGFANVYDMPRSVVVSLKAIKQASGFDLVDGQFRFNVYEEFHSDAAELTPDNYVTFATNDAEGNVEFPITFTKPGMYEYTLAEQNDGDEGIVYDSALRHVRVVVDQNYQATVTYMDAGGRPPVFVNRVNNGSVEAALEVQKVVNAAIGLGYTPKAGDFSFTMTPLGDAPGAVQVKANDKNGLVAFDNLVFTAPGTYQYTVQEVVPSADSRVPGIVYNDSVYTVTYTVAEVNGALVASRSVVLHGEQQDLGDTDPIEVANDYRASGNIELHGSKALSHATWDEVDTFTFNIGALKADGTVDERREDRPPGERHQRRSDPGYEQALHYQHGLHPREAERGCRLHHAGRGRERLDYQLQTVGGPGGSQRPADRLGPCLVHAERQGDRQR